MTSTDSPPDFVSTLEFLQSYSTQLHSLEPTLPPYDAVNQETGPDATALTTTLRSKIKSSHLNLARARRSKSSAALTFDSADIISTANLREEFVASIRIVPVSNGSGSFIGWKIADQSTEGDGKGEATRAVADSLEGSGLRRRRPNEVLPDMVDGDGTTECENVSMGKGKVDKPSPASSWEVINEPASDETGGEQIIDPIYMFGGIPPRALRIAQEKMREVVDELVARVAGDAVGVLRGLDEMEKMDCAEEKTE